VTDKAGQLVPRNIPRRLAALAANPPALFLPDEKASERFFGFFTVNIRNKNTRRAYYKAACRFQSGARAGDCTRWAM
jgi:hypothetical protein